MCFWALSCLLGAHDQFLQTTQTSRLDHFKTSCAPATWNGFWTAVCVLFHFRNTQEESSFHFVSRHSSEMGLCINLLNVRWSVLPMSQKKHLVRGFLHLCVPLNVLYRTSFPQSTLRGSLMLTGQKLWPGSLQGIFIRHSPFMWHKLVCSLSFWLWFGTRRHVFSLLNLSYLGQNHSQGILGMFLPWILLLTTHRSDENLWVYAVTFRREDTKHTSVLCGVQDSWWCLASNS